MAMVIDFRERRKQKLELKKVKLSTFGIKEAEVDTRVLYPFINPKYKVNIETTLGEGKEFIRCGDRVELFNELIRVSKTFDGKRVAWMVLDVDMDYVYIKELDKTYKSEKGVFEDRIKSYLYEYGIENLLILEKINKNTYRWIAV